MCNLFSSLYTSNPHIKPAAYSAVINQPINLKAQRVPQPSTNQANQMLTADISHTYSHTLNQSAGINHGAKFECSHLVLPHLTGICPRYHPMPVYSIYVIMVSWRPRNEGCTNHTTKMPPFKLPPPSIPCPTEPPDPIIGAGIQQHRCTIPAQKI